MHAIRHTVALSLHSCNPFTFLQSIEHNSSLKYDRIARRDRKTSIVCTVGPSTWEKPQLYELLMKA